jgi:parallel beta-helix repeat protein
VEYDTIENNLGGAGVGLGSNSITTDNCLTNNGEYGFSTICGADCSTLTSGAQNVTLTDNEISHNDSAGAYDHPGGISCGCSGGGKFWETDGATVTGNYVHDNGNVGLWVDTDNTGFNISGNTITNNWAEGIIYEISYNAEITDNTFTDNAWGTGPTNPGFATGAIYISESGGDSRVPGFSSGSLSITDNLFTDNWSGVVLWENPNRYCGSGNDASSTCTLVDLSVANPTTCTTAAIRASGVGSALYNDCRWHTQNVTVYGNSFAYTEADIPGCNLSSNSCGQNAIFSQSGSEPSWSPYKGSVIEKAITTEQNNEFSDNTYSGPWSFMYFDLGDIKTFAQWQSTYGQDASSIVASS